ncbi:MAG: hypothetical protein D6698_12535 [Gammaproteobacteria bacterium]|nr:MAG: hypothetical protein D6698_12535 [Gammaproteobacteria bacterium]
MLQLVFSNIGSFTPAALVHFFENYPGTSGRGLSPSTKNTIRAELKWLIRHVLRTEIPGELKKVLTKERVHSAGSAVTEDEFSTVLSSVSRPRFRLEFLHHTGMRPHELLSLRHKCLALSGNICVESVPELNPLVPSGRNKTGSRTVVIPRELGMMLQELEGDPLFPWSHKTLSTMFCKLKSELRRRGIPVKWRLYDLRHSRATELARRGMPEALLRHHMGWSRSSRMFDTYIHISGDHITSLSKMKKAKTKKFQNEKGQDHVLTVAPVFLRSFNQFFTERESLRSLLFLKSISDNFKLVILSGREVNLLSYSKSFFRFLSWPFPLGREVIVG